MNKIGNIKIFNRDCDSSPYSPVPNHMYINGHCESFQVYYYFNKTDNNITLVWLSQIDNAHCMFDGCGDIIKFDFSNFTSSTITHMGAMFRNCISLKSIDLSNFDTSLLTQTSNMFYNCTLLESLDLSKFNATKLNTLYDMFNHCSSLKALSLPNFNTLLNLKIERMFSFCSSLEYINLEYQPIHNNLFSDISDINPQKLIICGNEENWIINYKKIYINCYNDADNINSHICYINSYSNINFNDNKYICTKCGVNFHQKHNDPNNNYSHINCYESLKSFYLDNFLYKQCYSTCNNCDINGNDLYHNCLECEHNLQFILNISNQYKNCYSSLDYYSLIDSMLKNYNKTDLLSGSDIEFEIENVILSLTTTDNQKNNVYLNKTTINLNDCENKIKLAYNISLNDSLYIIKIDKKEKGMKIPKIEYELYYPLKGEELKALDLKKCKDLNLDISIPIDINDNIEKYDQKSAYYTDICSKVSTDKGVDISLFDRKNEFINNNMTICEEDCKLLEYNNDNKKVKCSCKIKYNLTLIENIKFDKNKLFRNFIDINNIANLKIMECFKNIINIKSLKNNYGFFIYIFILILFCITLLLFYFKYYFHSLKLIEIISNSRKKAIKWGKKNKNINIKNNSKKKVIINHKGFINKINKRLKKELSSCKKVKRINFSIKRKQRKGKQAINLKIYKNRLLTTNSERNNKENQFVLSKNNEYNSKNYIDILIYNDEELNELTYENALIYDKRTFLQYYFSLLKSGNLLIFAFYINNNDYNLQIIKIFLFFFFLSVDLMINALFFNDGTMHNIYESEGKFNLIYQIPQILYSTIISYIINSLIIYLSLIGRNISEIKKEKTKKDLNLKVKKIKRIVKIKFALFFIVSFLLLLFFSYYITCFCGIYINTQIHLIKDTLISSGLSFLYPFGICLIPCLLRISALNTKNKNKKYIYKLSQFIQI